MTDEQQTTTTPDGDPAVTSQARARRRRPAPRAPERRRPAEPAPTARPEPATRRPRSGWPSSSR